VPSGVVDAPVKPLRNEDVTPIEKRAEILSRQVGRGQSPQIVGQPAPARLQGGLQHALYVSAGEKMRFELGQADGQSFPLGEACGTQEPANRSSDHHSDDSTGTKL
jgi:hypothetical protein